MVTGAIQWDESMLDVEFEQQSHFTANIMLSTGNYKKGTKPDKIKEGLYIPIRDRESFARKHQHSGGIKPERSGKTSSADQVEEIKKRFNLD